MKLKILVHVQRPPQLSGRDVLHELLLQYRLDYTALLQLALDCWEALDADEADTLRCAVETRLLQEPRVMRRLDQQRLDFAQFQDLVTGVIQAVQEFHAALHPVLDPLVKMRLRDQEAQYRLARFFGTDFAAVVEVEPRGQGNRSALL